MGLESHVNDVLDDAGFKRRDWYWSDGLRWHDRTVAQKIVKTLNASGHFGRAKILPGASHRIVFGVYRPVGRSYVAGDKSSRGGKRRSGGGTSMSQYVTHGEWGVRWTEFDRNSRLVTKEKILDTEDKRDAFVRKLQKKDNYNGVVAYSSPQGPLGTGGLPPSGGKKRRASAAKCKRCGEKLDGHYCYNCDSYAQAVHRVGKPQKIGALIVAINRLVK